MQKTSHETIAAIVEALESSGAKAVVTSEDPLALFFNTSPDEPVNGIADSDDSEPRVLCGFVGDDGFGGRPRRAMRKRKRVGRMAPSEHGEIHRAL